MDNIFRCSECHGSIDGDVEYHDKSCSHINDIKQPTKVKDKKIAELKSLLVEATDKGRKEAIAEMRNAGSRSETDTY